MCTYEYILPTRIYSPDFQSLSKNLGGPRDSWATYLPCYNGVVLRAPPLKMGTCLSPSWSHQCPGHPRGIILFASWSLWLFDLVTRGIELHSLIAYWPVTDTRYSWDFNFLVVTFKNNRKQQVKFILVICYYVTMSKI